MKLPDPMAEDELESILHLNGCQQRTAGYNERVAGKDIDMEDMERLEKLTLQEVRAYTTNKIIEELESVFSDFDGELWYAHPRMAKGNVANEITLADRIAELKALNHRKDEHGDSK